MAKPTAEAPAPKSRWTRIGSGTGWVIRVMGTVEEWVIARHKSAAPFVEHVNQWRDRFEPAPPAGRAALASGEERGR